MLAVHHVQVHGGHAFSQRTRGYRKLSSTVAANRHHPRLSHPCLSTTNREELGSLVADAFITPLIKIEVGNMGLVTRYTITTHRVMCVNFSSLKTHVAVCIPAKVGSVLDSCAECYLVGLHQSLTTRAECGTASTSPRDEALRVHAAGNEIQRGFR